jgi:DNA-binding response OmpR family regulator
MTPMRSTEFENWLESVSRPPRFLIVEDDTAFAEMLEEVSTRYDCIVDVVGGVRAAIERLAKEKFRLLILDFNLPGESGMDLLRYLCAQRINIPIVILSGCITQRLIDEAQDLGLVAWVTKPRTNVIDQLHALFRLLNVKERIPGGY